MIDDLAHLLDKSPILCMTCPHERSHAFMNYEPVSPTNLPKSAITDLAEKVALEFGYA